MPTGRRAVNEDSVAQRGRGRSPQLHWRCLSEAEELVDIRPVPSGDRPSFLAGIGHHKPDAMFLLVSKL